MSSGSQTLKTTCLAPASMYSRTRPTQSSGVPAIGDLVEKQIRKHKQR